MLAEEVLKATFGIDQLRRVFVSDSQPPSLAQLLAQQLAYDHKTPPFSNRRNASMQTFTSGSIWAGGGARRWQCGARSLSAAGAAQNAFCAARRTEPRLWSAERLAT